MTTTNISTPNAAFAFPRMPKAYRLKRRFRARRCRHSSKVRSSTTRRAVGLSPVRKPVSAAVKRAARMKPNRGCPPQPNPLNSDPPHSAGETGGIVSTDLGPAVVGSIGIAPSGNINPEREYPSMFEPVHGSAPDIAGRGIANPVGQIWSGAMMLEHFGENDAAAAVERAIAEVLAEGGTRTPGLGGNAGTKDLGAAITAAIG